MLRRIPGAQAILDTNSQRAQARGFGAGGAQVLLNGRRFPGKSNDIVATLRRIPASNVARIEMISGASSEITVQSQGTLVNVVLREGASIGGSGAYELNYRFNDEGWSNVDGLLNYSRTFGALTVGGGVERNLWTPDSIDAARWTTRRRQEVYFYPSGVTQELRPQFWDRRHDKWIYTGNLSYEFSGGQSATLNGMYQTRRVDQIDTTPLVRFGPAGAETLRATEVHEQITDTVKQLELSGEYTARFGPGDFTALMIVQRNSEPTLDFRNREEPLRFVEVSRRDSRVKTGEDIVRLSYVFPVGAGKSLEIGGEGARNRLEQHLDVFLDRNGDGRLEPAFVPIADPEVKELRGEAYATLKWQATTALSLDSALNYERSKLTTNYPLYPGRKLGFLKPRLDARYRLDARTQLRFLAERRVSQLDFANFVPSYNAIDDRVEAGNPQLQPEKTWAFELGYERRLANDGGRIELRGFYNDITDAIDWVPITDARGVLVSAQGNIPSATLYGAEARVSLRLGFIGLQGAQVNLRGLRQWSSVEDPFTGEERRLQSDRGYTYDVGYRHDVRRLSYGFNYRSAGRSSIISNLLVREYYSMDPLLEAFVERGLWRTMILRLELQNLTHSPERRWRQNFLVNAIDGRLRRIDFYEERRDIRGAVRLRGRF
jgi:hypothetical protein